MSLGANQKDPLQVLDSALEKLAANAQISLLDSSGDWLTEPWGPIPQSWFVNRDVLVESKLNPRELLAACQQVEESLGRKRGLRWGSRAIDIDLIWAGEMRVNDSDLNLPHLRAHERGFVLRPWLEIDPDAVLDGVPVVDLVASLDSRGFGSTCVRYK